MKAFITKYALTQGIMEVDCSQSKEIPSMISYTLPGYYWEVTVHGEGRDWHRTLDGAKAKAEKMRLKQIKSLKKSIEKLERLKF